MSVEIRTACSDSWGTIVCPWPGSGDGTALTAGVFGSGVDGAWRARSWTSSRRVAASIGCAPAIFDGGEVTRIRLLKANRN